MQDPQNSLVRLGYLGHVGDNEESEPIEDAFNRLSAWIDNARSGGARDVSIPILNVLVDFNNPEPVLQYLTPFLQDPSLEIDSLTLGAWVFKAATMAMLTTALDANRSVNVLSFYTCNLMTNHAAAMRLLADFMARQSRIDHLKFFMCDYFYSTGNSFGRAVGELVASSSTALSVLEVHISGIDAPRPTNVDGSLVGDLLEQISTSSLRELRLHAELSAEFEALWHRLPELQGIRFLKICVTTDAGTSATYQSSLLAAFRANYSLHTFEFTRLYSNPGAAPLVREHIAARVSVYTKRNERLPDLLLLMDSDTDNMLPLLPSLLAASRTYSRPNEVRPATVRNFLLGLCHSPQDQPNAP
jgi:hypothetical protein